MTTTLDARTLMERLIAFPTVSRDSNLELIGFVESYLSEHGINSTRVPDETGEKAALYAHVGPQVEGAIVLSGHTDVVPVDGQAWDTDPFEVVEKGDKLFGRGTCDMKGFDALSIWALVEAKKRNVTRPLQLALSYDEEVGCTGAPVMIDAMVSSGMPRASAAIIGEPSMMKVVTGHKGGIGFDVHMRGFEVHSSLIHTGVNAIMFGAKLIDWCNEMNAINADKAPLEIDADFVPPYTTLHVGMVTGGTAHNITAKDCNFVLTFRAVPGEPGDMWVKAFEDKVAEIEAEMKAIHPDTGIDYTRKFDVPGLKPEVAGEAEEIVRNLTGDNAVNVVSYGTEAGQFQERGYSAVICGPGDIAQAHQPNEFITIEQFKAGEAFMERLLDSLG
ncbi:acetylornithine deacetylase [Octadecabacter temperatus]|uniref:Acetylornithine deacetylase n=1 Tax=Octadecabacter temperatus TaxID=1458307 RepID=A0A0K0Y475_9RHOB|nr:acetylornithine deacetylase [Octadecabacter temperatus]AKS45715.1 Acetylornithine deacetylase [Octadecabacter temperatus]SIN98937.1 acetylornithine deacetylase [Octadecabacter temperatus]